MFAGACLLFLANQFLIDQEVKICQEPVAHAYNLCYFMAETRKIVVQGQPV
jgi:hypothetical protein